LRTEGAEWLTPAGPAVLNLSRAESGSAATKIHPLAFRSRHLHTPKQDTFGRTLTTSVSSSISRLSSPEAAASVRFCRRHDVSRSLPDDSESLKRLLLAREGAIVVARAHAATVKDTYSVSTSQSKRPAENGPGRPGRCHQSG